MQEKSLKNSPKLWWRPFFSYLFIVLASCSLVALIATRYVDRTVLNTDNFVSIVGDLPQQPTVSAAISTYVSEEIYNKQSSADTIANFLPPKLAPIASPLAAAIQKEVYQLTYSFIQSDKFANLWISANRNAHSFFLTQLSNPPRQDKSISIASYNINLSGLADSVTKYVSSNRPEIISPQQLENIQNFRLSTKQKVNNLRTYVKVVHNSALGLPYIFVALTLAGIAVAYNRRRALIVASVLSLFTASLFVIAGKIGLTQILGQISSDVYKSAAQTIYEAFYHNLQTRMYWLMGISAGLILILWLTSQQNLAKRLRVLAHIKPLSSTFLWSYARITRSFVRKYYYYFVAGCTIITIGFLLLTSTVSWLILAESISILITLISIIYMIARADLKTAEPI